MSKEQSNNALKPIDYVHKGLKIQHRSKTSQQKNNEGK